MNRRVAALIQRYLDEWRALGALEAPGALGSTDGVRAIDDGGGYGDPHPARTMPDEWAKDTDGWTLLARLRR